MKIYDCFMFYDETMLLEIRLNILNKFVDKFIITEASYLHNGHHKKLNFDIKNFQEFKNKIEYIVVNDHPASILELGDKDNESEKSRKKIINSLKRENFQREELAKGLLNIDNEDLIIISDVDEIPNLESLKFNERNNEIIIFKQKMFYYKFNLFYKDFIWYGSKAVKKKNFYSPQWLRNIKSKKYPFWRVDTHFSKKKYNNIKFIENGGWHFTCIKSPEEVHKKLLSYLHHQDYEKSNVSLIDLKNKMANNETLYDHKKDKKNSNKWFSDEKLIKIDLNELPAYLINQNEKYQEWFES